MNNEAFKDRFKHFTAYVGMELLKRTVNMELKGKENAEKAKQLLCNHSGLLTFNHLSIFDLLAVLKITQERYGEGIHYMYPASDKHFKGTFENSYITDMIHIGAEASNIELISTVQSGGHVANTAEAGLYAQNVREGNEVNPNFSMLRRIKRNMQKPQNVLVMSQEGGRSRTGSMVEAQRPIDFFVTPNTFVQPFSIWGTENIHKVGAKSFNPLARIHVFVGEPIMHDDLYQEACEWNIDITTLISLHSARNLPGRYRGFYGAGNYPDFYNYHNGGVSY